MKLLSAQLSQGRLTAGQVTRHGIAGEFDVGGQVYAMAFFNRYTARVSMRSLWGSHAGGGPYAAIGPLSGRKGTRLAKRRYPITFQKRP